MPAAEKQVLEILRKYFDQREDIAFAFLFGSSARGKIRREGDIDVAVYFWSEEGLEWESVKKRYPGESRILIEGGKKKFFLTIAKPHNPLNNMINPFVRPRYNLAMNTFQGMLLNGYASAR